MSDHKGQRTMPVGHVNDAPPLPARFAASAASRYAKRKVARREHCGACVSLCHHDGHILTPRPPAWERTVIGQEPVLLCYQHGREYRDRDNAAREQANAPRLPDRRR